MPGNQKTKSKKPQRASVYIVGESPLVEEYAGLCAEKGFDVFLQWNTALQQLPTLSAKHIKRTSVIPKSVSVGLELTNTDTQAKQANLKRLDRALPPTALILTSSITVTTAEQSQWISGRYRLCGFSALPSFVRGTRVEVAPGFATARATVEVVQRFFQSLGKSIEVVQDRVGMVLPRIVCQLVNEAAFAIQEEVASPQDIDTAMKLGTNYPYGPIEWGNRIGFNHVYQVLQALQTDLQEERYRISPLLTALAQTGEWWKKK